MVKPLSVLALAGLAVAQNSTAPDLVTALTGAASELSTLAGLVPASILQTLSSLQNITLLAPSNAAFAKVDNATLTALSADPGLLAALLTYHVLNGTFPSTAITDNSVFVPSLLTNTSYANVTGGQRVEVEKEDDKVVIYSGLGTNSTVTTAVCVYESPLPIALANPHTGRNVHRRCNPHHRHGPLHPPRRQRRPHRWWPNLTPRRPSSRQPCRHGKHDARCHHLRAQQRGLPEHWLCASQPHN